MKGWEGRATGGALSSIIWYWGRILYCTALIRLPRNPSALLLGGRKLPWRHVRGAAATSLGIMQINKLI